MSLLDFDATKHYLGNICGRGHNWNNSGFSLRKRTNGGCTDCKRECDRIHREKHSVANRKSPEDRTYLGKLCIYGHDWEGTGKSLRIHQKNECIVCKSERDRKYRTGTARESILERKKEYYYSKRDVFKVKFKLYRLQKADYLKIYHQEYWRSHKDIIRDKKRQRYQTDATFREKKLSKGRIYSLNNREKRNIGLRRYRARKKQAAGLPYSYSDVMQRYTVFGHRCAYCETDLTTGRKALRQIDHFLPISQGGRDVLGNIIPACISCNASKCDRDPITWFRSKGFPEKRLKKILKVLGKTEANYTQIPLL